MDIFSAGCVISEIFNDGQPLFSYGELLSFAEGKTNPDLSGLPEAFQELVQVINISTIVIKTLGYIYMFTYKFLIVKVPKFLIGLSLILRA